MATVAAPVDRINHTEATDMMKKLSLDAPPKALEIPDAPKKASVDPSNGVNAQTPSYERSMTPLLQDFMDPAVGYIPNYPGYYYGSYDGAAKEWDDYARYANPEGAGLSQGVLGDNGGLMYPPWYAPYAPYSPAGSPVPAMGQDGQLYGSQHYQYPFYQPLNATSPPFNPTPAAKGGNSAPTAADKAAPFTMETATGNAKTIANGGSVKGHNSSASTKQIYQNSAFNSGSSYGFTDPWLGYDSMRSPMPWFDTSAFPNGQQRPLTNGSNGKNSLPSKNQNFRPQSSIMGFQPRPMSGLNPNGYMNSMYPNKYGNYGGAFRSSFPFGSNGYDSRNGRGWSIVDNKYKTKGRSLYGGYGNENVDGLNELNRGPRARNNYKNQKGFTPVALAVKGQTIPLSLTADEKDNITGVVPDREIFNKPDFPETYADAKFYIIKSYSEDDIHKSIKYNVWASTPNGNKKLDAAYQEAQKSGGCPVFLFFSVNTSGQFVGVAEMAGPVDFHKNFEYWQQDKWNGFFPVKWHIVKDVSNSLLKHITLEYNENKPVTNSRDTQEVRLEQGLEMLKIFKDHSSKTCILDDFSFYEARQKAIQEKKAKQQQFQKPTPGKPTTEVKNIDAGINGELNPQKSLEPAADVVQISENGSVKKADEAKNVENGVVNGVVDNGV